VGGEKRSGGAGPKEAQKEEEKHGMAAD